MSLGDTPHNILSKQSICGFMVIIPYLNNEYTSIATHYFTNVCNCGVRYDYARVQYFVIVNKLKYILLLRSTRFLCLRCGLHLQPAKACNVIIVSLMLHNHARRMNFPVPEDPSDSSSSVDDDEDDNCDDMNERARAAAGKGQPVTGIATNVFRGNTVPLPYLCKIYIKRCHWAFITPSVSLV